MGKNDVKLKLYLLKFKNRVRKRVHMIYVDSPEEAVAMLEQYGNQHDPAQTFLYKKIDNALLNDFLSK